VPIATTIKHFAGDSAGEGGRASYYENGKYSVYPGNNHPEHLKPFLGSLDAMGAMTAYSLLVDGEGKPLYGDKAVGAAYSKELVDILRVDNDYDGVIMTDWGVTAGGPTDPDATWFVPWGVEDLTVEQRHFGVLLTGIDMFGGNTDAKPVLAAHDLWQKAYEAGEVDIDADARFVQSAERILRVIFASGIYDNPFLDLEESKAITGSKDKMDAGFEAQKQSVVILKNSGAAIPCDATAADWSDKTVYIPGTHGFNRIGLLNAGDMETGPSIDVEVAEQYFGKVLTDDIKVDDAGNVTYTVPDISDVDLVLVGMESPNSDGHGYNDETGEYLPISLQYRPYTADNDSVRTVSLAGDTLPDGTRENRSYFGKTAQATNEPDLDALERAAEAVKATGRDIPVVVSLVAQNPVVPTEFEPLADAIVVGFDISQEALIEVALGLHDGSGRLPMSFPASMATVEASFEDTAGDFDAYTDADGNAYSFGFGLTCKGSPIK
jgi:beta-glucosidase